jgi:ribonucleotide reductase alpha subunit
MLSIENRMGDACEVLVEDSMYGKKHRIFLSNAELEHLSKTNTVKWYHLFPHRGRANNSAVIVRHKVKKKDFSKLWKDIEASGSGEPGIYLTNNPDAGTNPCKPLKSLILTDKGYISFAEALEMDSLRVVTPKGKIVEASKPFKTGENREVYKVMLSDGNVLYGTGNHLHQLDSGEWLEVRNLEVGYRLAYREIEFSPEGKVLLRSSGYRTVCSVSLDSIEDVYDITVYDEDHAFIDTGIVTHNCCEIALLPYQFCNLVEVNASTLSSQQDLDDRVKAATFLGTLQAGYTNFHYLRDVWRKTTEKEALLGVSMTGICSGDINSLDLTAAANAAVAENKRVAAIIGIREAARITCVKPAGTTSLVLGTSSGIHAWHSPYYLRRIRVGKNESLYKYLAAHHPTLVEDEYFSPSTQAVIQVPVKAPEGAIFRDESALDLLNRVKRFSVEWIQPGHIKGDNTHNVSATVSIKPNEWEEVGNWMWENRAVYNGISVLPHDGGTYIQAPFEDITEERYNELVQHLNKVDLSNIRETEDTTDLKGEVACAGGACELTF